MFEIYKLKYTIKIQNSTKYHYRETNIFIFLKITSEAASHLPHPQNHNWVYLK